MQPENTNPNFNPAPNDSPQPGQFGQGNFQRRTVQPLSPRPHSAPPAQPAFAPPQSQAPFGPPQPAQPHQPTQPPIGSFPSQPSAPPQVPPQAPQPPQPAQNRFASPNPAPAFQPQTNQFTPQAPAQTAPQSAQNYQQSFSSPAAPAFAQPQSNFDEPVRTAFPQPVRPKVVEKPSLPKGLFILLPIGVLGLVIGLMDKSQHNMVYNAILAANLLLALAILFLRKDMLRKAAFGFAMIAITASSALVLSYWSLTGSTVNAEAAFIAEAKKLQNMSPTKQLTHEQQQHLDAMQLQLEAQQKAVGKHSELVYGKYGTTVLMYGLAAFYLTRPKVKEAFQEVEK